jgi:four helix bundle protein
MHPADELQLRTKAFAMRIMKMCQAMSAVKGMYPISNQLLRSGTAVAANYRATCRARSDAEFAAKIGIVLEEIDETEFWLELLRDGDIFSEGKLAPILDEAQQLVRIFAASKRTVSDRTRNQKSEIRNQKSGNASK